MTFVDFLNTLLPILLYTAGITLLIVLIIIGVKIIRTMNRVEDIVEDVDQKMKSLDGVFHIIDTTADKISFLTDKVVDVISSFVIKLFNKKYNKTKETEENHGEEE